MHQVCITLQHVCVFWAYREIPFECTFDQTTITMRMTTHIHFTKMSVNSLRNRWRSTKLREIFYKNIFANILNLKRFSQCRLFNEERGREGMEWRRNVNEYQETNVQQLSCLCFCFVIYHIFIQF